MDEQIERERLHLELSAFWAGLIPRLGLDSDTLRLALNCAPLIPDPGALPGWHLQVAPEHYHLFTPELGLRLCAAVNKHAAMNPTYDMHFRIEAPEFPTPQQIAERLSANNQPTLH